MRIRLRISLFSFVLTLIAGFSSNIFASCSWIEPGPPCQVFWQTDVVFVGQVIEVVELPSTSRLAIRPDTVVRLSVDEAFKGVDAREVTLNLDRCGYEFKQGKRYLVYANRNSSNHKLDVRSGFSRTRPISEAKEDLEYLRGLPPAEEGSRVYGTVTLSALNIRQSKYDSNALSGIRVILEGNGRHEEASRDAEGRYQFSGIATGTYSIHAAVDRYLYRDPGPIKVNPPECLLYNFSFGEPGQIKGKILDADGHSISSVAVSIVSADAGAEILVKDQAWTFSTSTDDGSFEFSELPPGRYLLVINRSDFERSRQAVKASLLPTIFYPGTENIQQASVITIVEGKKLPPVIIRLPFK